MKHDTRSCLNSACRYVPCSYVIRTRRNCHRNINRDKFVIVTISYTYQSTMWQRNDRNRISLQDNRAASNDSLGSKIPTQCHTFAGSHQQRQKQREMGSNGHQCERSLRNQPCCYSTFSSCRICCVRQIVTKTNFFFFFLHSLFIFYAVVNVFVYLSRAPPLPSRAASVRPFIISLVSKIMAK